MSKECLSCGGEHEPDSDKVYVDYEGYRFRKPFRCMCCGKKICARQFAFGRACGACDRGVCQAFQVSAVHERPEWVIPLILSIKKFAEAVKAEPLGLPFSGMPLPAHRQIITEKDGKYYLIEAWE